MANYHKTEEVDSLVKSILDSIYCSAIILAHDASVLYFNTSAERLVKGANIGFDFLLNKLGEQVDLARGTGRYQIKFGETKIICRVHPRVVDGIRQGSTIMLHESMQPECLAQEMEVTTSILQQLNVVLESSHDGILVADSKGNVIRVNTGFERALLVNRRDILGRNLADLLKEGIIEETSALNALRTREASTVIVDNKDKKLILTASPVFNNGNELIAVVTNVRDISELNNLRKKLEYQRMVSGQYAKELSDVVKQQIGQSEFVVCSKEMKRILNTIQAISTVDSTVLITGESGTGKEMVINEIYRTSMRSNMPIIKINCGAIPAALFESELFGYEDGAFTGAKRQGKPGCFELANGGTLLLDEIGELNMDLQVKLLRVLQEMEVTRIGGIHPVKIDVRIIAATNQNLWEMTEQGKFRLDLYYRLNVIDIEVPPLRRRQDDIIPLSIHMLERYNKKYNKHKELSYEMGKTLRALNWWGNVRELENLIENLVVLIQEDVLIPEHLPSRYRTQVEASSKIIIKGIMPMKEMVRQAERQLISNAQAQYSSTQEVARALGVDASTISRKLNSSMEQ